MCKSLALSALLANSNAKASAIASAIVTIASAFSTTNNIVPAQGGGKAESRKPNAEPQSQSEYFYLLKHKWHH